MAGVPRQRATTAIAPARRSAYAVLRRVFERGAYADQALHAECAGSDPRDRALAMRLSYGAIQHRGTLDHLISGLAERPAEQLDPPLLAALRLGLYELLYLGGAPDYAVVADAVELAKGQARAGHGLVNAVLRRAARERAGLTTALLEDDSTAEAAAVAHSSPAWLARQWWQELGADAACSLLASCNEPAEVAMSVSLLRGDREAALTKLREAGVEADPATAAWPLGAAETIVISGRTGDSVPALVGAGELTPQSRGSAAVVEVLDPRQGEHVLDLCAGPGIKTGQIATRMGDRGEVISIELDPDRAGEVAAQARRLGLRSVTVIEADVTGEGTAPGFDRVLLDAPCSDLGALASRPDARWRKSPKAIERMVDVQERALLGAARVLRPGGVLVYSTCTISRRENEDRVAALLAASAAGEVPPLELEDLGARAPELASAIEPRCLQLRPDRDRTTGFFISRLRRHD
jgi:16S rRNA (cytosine967-C5)-methyltransferase